MCTQIKALRADSKLEEDGQKRIYERAASGRDETTLRPREARDCCLTGRRRAQNVNIRLIWTYAAPGRGTQEGGAHLQRQRGG
jgi:hypothetical protein